MGCAKESSVIYMRSDPSYVLTYLFAAFGKIAAAGGRHQWTLGISFRQTPEEAFTPLVCKTPVYDACFNSSSPAPYNKPMKVLDDGQVQMAYTFKPTATALKLYGTNRVPMDFEFRVRAGTGHDCPHAVFILAFLVS
jgi:hypothetical protein